MKKRFLGIVCILYSLIIIYVWLFDKLKNYLAPSMQMYLKVALIPMLIIGIVLLFSKKDNHKFKVTDLVLLIPIIALILANDGRLTTSLVKNRMSTFTNEEKRQSKKEEVKEKIEEPKEEYDLSNIDFEVVDEAYSEITNNLTFLVKPDKYVGKTIKIRGFVNKKEQYLPKGYYAIGKYVVSCCAADALFSGLIVKEDKNIEVKDNNWYEIKGVLEKTKDSEGYDILTVKVIEIKEIDSKAESQYVYPCYNYGDGSCEAVTKYNLEY